jgi:PadR family transcriptional regulator, regulatory protein PadR
VIWRKEKARQAIIDEFVAAPRDRWLYSLDVMRAARVRSGLYYRVIGSLERAGWLEATWEDAEPGRKHRRRLYRLTPTGRVGAAEREAVRDGTHWMTRRPDGR